MDTNTWAWLLPAALVLASACADAGVSEGEDTDTSATGSDATTDETGGGSSSCGDGIVDPGEDCDDGDGNGAAQACTHLCQTNVCGDGFEQIGVEACDDGNDDDADACTNACTLAACGDGIVQDGEQCDDGNDDDADGCTSACAIPAPTALAIGGFHSCALYNTGAVYCWGQGELGAHGHGTTVDVGAGQLGIAEVGPVELGGPAVEIVAGASHSCARMATGEVRCWGGNAHGELGLGTVATIGDDEPPTAVAPVALGEGAVVELAAGYYHTCARFDAGEVRCWGSGEAGRLGYGDVANVGDDEDPASAGPVELGGTAVALTGGYSHTCAALEGGEVRCWGQGGLGYGDGQIIGDDETPAAAGVVALDAPVVDLAAAFGRTCAVFDDGGVACWGIGSYGALGLPGVTSVGEDDPPLTHGRVDIGGHAVAIAAGGAHNCAVLDGGVLRCFGRALSGQLGHGDTVDVGDDETPASAGPVDLGASVVEVGAGLYHTCARLSSGAVRCWGSNEFGQLGLGAYEPVGDDEPPTAVPAVPLP